MTSQPPPRQPPPASGEPLDSQPTREEAGVAVGAIVDIDGTLVDTNYHHTVAWGRAFADHGIDVALWRIHRHNGMGGDQLVAAVAGDDVEERLGEAIRDSESRRYAELIDEVRPLPGAHDLLAGIRGLGCPVVLASSAKRGEVERYVDLLDAHGVVDAWTTGADVDRTKPHPDLIAAAAERLPEVSDFVVIGDTAWDAVAAGRAGFPAIGLLSGGFGASELCDAGCISVFVDAADLAAHLESALDAARSAPAAAAR
ncbi:MAG TPA: HAD family hydrolase [Gaiellales bacterium]|jgi:beta-phosphoglucomutase-like phosphatase (HAD superfamily)